MGTGKDPARVCRGPEVKLLQDAEGAWGLHFENHFFSALELEGQFRPPRFAQLLVGLCQLPLKAEVNILRSLVRVGKPLANSGVMSISAGFFW